jgi:hypothetical protein
MTETNVPGTRRPRRFWLDLGERVAWTAAQVALAGVTVDAFDLPSWAVLPTAAALAALKGLVARRVGSSDSAATLPA